MAVEPCEVCGPQAPPTIHVICHTTHNKRTGCGHDINDHTKGMKCKVCGNECGLSCNLVK